MGFNCGIVGLPNVGKSTIFNALAAAGAEAANYPFCTIEPNTGVVGVPDARLEKLLAVSRSAKAVGTTIEFVDIAGLVKGASQGEGLGNQFLGHIRGVDALVHVVRCFADPNVSHVYESLAPRRDIEIVETELLLADLETVERRLEKVQKLARLGDKSLTAEVHELEQLRAALSAGRAAREAALGPSALSLGLLTAKPVLFVANVDECDASATADGCARGPIAEMTRAADERKAEAIIICGRLEAEIAELDSAERGSFLRELGMRESGLERLAHSAVKALNLITFFTINSKEVHAWTAAANTSAVEAAAKVHTDLAKGFIRAEVISCEDYLKCGGEAVAREHGLMRIEGRDYIVRDGDVIHVRFNV